MKDNFLVFIALVVAAFAIAYSMNESELATEVSDPAVTTEYTAQYTTDHLMDTDDHLVRLNKDRTTLRMDKSLCENPESAVFSKRLYMEIMRFGMKYDSSEERMKHVKCINM